MADGALLKVNDLHGWYGESHVLHGMAFEIHPGEVVTLLGRNGVGKTSTMRAIMGMLPRRAGSIAFAGTETIRLTSNKIARLGLGYCPEERGIFASLNVRENLMLPPVVQSGGLSVDEVFGLFPRLAKDAFDGGADLSTTGKAAPCDTPRRIIQVRIFQDDRRIVAAQLHRDRGEIGSRARHDLTARFRTADEYDLVHGAGNERRTDASVAMRHLKQILRQADRFDRATQQIGGDRGIFARLGNNRVSRDQCRKDRARQRPQRIIPRREYRDHSQRFFNDAPAFAKGRGHPELRNLFVGEYFRSLPGEIVHMRGEGKKLGGDGLDARFAALARDDVYEFVLMVIHIIREGQQMFAESAYR